MPKSEILPPDQAAELRARLQAHDAAEAEAAREAARAPLKPLEKALKGEEKLTIEDLLSRLRDVQAAIPSIDRVAPHFHAAVVGLEGVLGYGRGLFEPASPATPQP